MLDDTRSDMNRMDFDNMSALEIQEFNFPFHGVFGTENCYSYLPMTEGDPST